MFFCNGKGFEYFLHVVTNLFRKKAKNSIRLSFKCQKQRRALLTSMQNGFGERLSCNNYDYYNSTFQKFERKKARTLYFSLIATKVARIRKFVLSTCTV